LSRAKIIKKKVKIMETKTLTGITEKNEEKGVRMINSFSELSAENDEIIESIESLRKSNSAIKAGCSEILSSTNKLLESVKELALLIN
jgi:flagellar biosynthesis/type III secretory pathway chaperone